MHKLLLPASLALTLAWPCGARADTASEVEALRREVDALRASYEARLQALEQRLKAAEAGAAATTASPPPAPVAAPSPAAAVAGASAFNPAISLILSGLYTRTSKDPSTYSIAGFALPPGSEVGPGVRGPSLAESELAFSASVDPWWRGAAHLALHPDDSVSVEEAYVQTTALGSGLTLKAGRFYSGIGYLNSQHAHAWDFVDNPLAYQALLGTQFADDGVQLRWLAPIERYVELGIELGRGRSFPGGDSAGNGVGAAALTAHTGGDIGDSHDWRIGASLLGAKADGLALASAAASGAPVASAFSGRSRTWVADAVWKWAPHGNASRTSFKLQGEWLRSTRSGTLVYDPPGAASAGVLRAVQSGWYLQGVYKFMPRWRVGLRTERLDAGMPDYGANAGLFAGAGARPRKTSLMLDWSASEFSRLRLQLARDRARPDGGDTQLFLQYQMSLGAHGAHGY